MQAGAEIIRTICTRNMDAFEIISREHLKTLPPDSASLASHFPVAVPPQPTGVYVRFPGNYLGVLSRQGTSDLQSYLSLLASSTSEQT
jgi:hypothetical protein